MEINAIGLACPKPVIMAKKVMRANPEENLSVLVDNEIATQNLTKLANQMHYNATTRPLSPEKYLVELIPQKVEESVQASQKIQQKKSESKANVCEIMDDFEEPYIVVFSSDEMGSGDAEFSKTLIEGFIYALCEQDNLPKHILFYNKGVFLTAVNPTTIKDLQVLQERGVEILSCGLCLEHYQLKENLSVGSITNMYRICELMSKYRNVMPC